MNIRPYMRFLRSGSNRVIAAILLTVILALSCGVVKGAGGTYFNGMMTRQSIMLADPRDNTVSYCTPTDAPVDKPEPEFPYVCVHIPAEVLAPALTPCGLAKTDQGPEIVCGEHWLEYKKSGALPGQTGA